MKVLHVFALAVLLAACHSNNEITAEKNGEFDPRLSKDSVTEAVSPVRTIPQSQITDCDKAAEAIFLSAPAVQKQLDEKYVNWKLEFRPKDAGNSNGRYWFWVFADKPNSAGTETYARYQVDPKTGKLFLYDAISEELTPIAYDSTLNMYMGLLCGHMQ